MDDQEKKQRLLKLTQAINESLIKMLPKETQIKGGLLSVLDRIVERGGINSDNKTKELGIKFLKEAESDVKTCLLLHKKKIYSHAVYHLQQAVEKAVKSYVLIEGFYNANEIKKIANHQSPLIIMQALIDKTGMRQDAIQRDDKTTITMITQAEQAIVNEEMRVAVAKISRMEVNEILSKIDGFHSMAITLMNEVKDIFKNEGLPPFSDMDIRAIMIPQDLLILAMITFPHCIFTRYPGSKITPTDYAPSFGVVKELPKIVARLEEELGTLEWICQ